MLLVHVLLGAIAALLVAFTLRVLQFKAKYPDKSYIIATLNIALAPLRALRLGPYREGKLTFENSMQQAMKATKLSDFGDLKFVENYKIVTDTAFFKNLTLTNLGYITAQKELQILLRKRLKFIHYMKTAPQVLKVPIKSPIFVFGLGRSGTTFVHRLMACDPKLRSPKLWELVMPVPDVPAG